MADSSLSIKLSQLISCPLTLRLIDSSHFLHLDLHFPDAVFSPFTALAESRYLGRICTIDISVRLSMIVPAVLAVEKILNS